MINKIYEAFAGLIGIKTAATSLSVTPASDAVFTATSPKVTKTDKSGSIATGGAAQDFAAVNASRKCWDFQNTSDTNMRICDYAAASATVGKVIIPGQLYECPAEAVTTNALSVYCATTGKTFIASEGV